MSFSFHIQNQIKKLINPSELITKITALINVIFSIIFEALFDLKWDCILGMNLEAENQILNYCCPAWPIDQLYIELGTISNDPGTK